MFDSITTGAADDILNITKIANSFVKAFGMSDNIGLVSYGRNEEE